MFKRVFSGLVVVLALGACSDQHDQLPAGADGDAALAEVEAEAVEGSEFSDIFKERELEPQSASQVCRDVRRKEWRALSISFFSCRGTANSIKSGREVELSIRGCTDDTNGDALINCAGGKVEPSIVVSRTLFKMVNGIKTRDLTKTIEIPASMISSFERVVNRISIRMNRVNIDLADGHRRTIKFRGYKAKPGQLTFSNVSNSSGKKVLIFNFGAYMNGGVQASLQCSYN